MKNKKIIKLKQGQLV